MQLLISHITITVLVIYGAKHQNFESVLCMAIEDLCIAACLCHAMLSCHERWHTDDTFDLVNCCIIQCLCTCVFSVDLVYSIES